MMVAVPPARRRLETLLGGALQADCLEGVLHAAVGQLADLQDRVAA